MIRIKLDMNSPRQALLFSVAIILGGCGSSGGINAGSQSQEASQGETPVSVDAEDFPGFPAELKDDCTPLDGVQSLSTEHFGWEPLNSMSNRSPFVIDATITSISSVRSSDNDGSDSDGIVQFYYRILTLSIGDHSIDLHEQAPRSGQTIELMILGAGPRATTSDLCYGEDNSQDLREPPLAPGDRLFFFSARSDPASDDSNARSYYLLNYGLAGLWGIDASGAADSVVPGFSTDFEGLRARIESEWDRGLVPFDELDPLDPFSSIPEIEEVPVPPTPSTTIPTVGTTPTSSG